MPPRRCRGALGAVSLGLLLGIAAEARSTEVLPAAVDVRRMHVQSERVLAPTSRGELAALTLDPGLTLIGGRLLDLARPVEGALVALDPRTGRVLAWNEKRKSGVPGSVITSARAPAASVFKLVTTTALFEAGGVHPRDRVCISGGLRGIERKHLDEPAGTDVSCAPFGEALGHSRNAAFAQLATRRLMRGDLIDTGGRFGFNGSVPFDWPVPVGQLAVPYNDLAFARTAAGFQGSTLSPLGGAYIASVVAAGGLGRRLRLIEPSAAEDDEPDAPEAPLRVMSATTAWRITRMMEVTVHSGTCRSVFTDATGRSFLPGVRVAGKTGTLRPETGTPTASWFIGFAPSRQPRVVVSVLLQNGAVWHKRAAEVARDFFRAYFHREGTPGVEDPFASPPTPAPP